MVDNRAAGKLRRLISELVDEVDALKRLGAEVAEAVESGKRHSMDAPHLALLAVRLHRYYTSLERILQRIERSLGSEPTGGDWHLALLVGATREIKSVRPAVLPPTVVGPLREILRFRHFFRHAYAVEFDAVKLRQVAEFVAAIRAQVESALIDFTEFLELAAAELERS